MDAIGLPYILTLAILLFVIGLSVALFHTDRWGIAVGAFLMLLGSCVAQLAFITFLPVYLAKPWIGYGGVILTFGGLLRYGMRVVCHR